MNNEERDLNSRSNLLSRGSVLLLLAGCTFFSVAQGQDAREILDQLENNQRSTSNSAFNKMQMSSCLFGIKNNKIKCAERPRIKSLETVGVNYGPNNKDTKTIAIILEPAAERGIGMLSFNYDNAEKDNETWLYLSALGQVKRIASGNSDDDSEPASFFGSEFTTEDMDNGKLDEYEINLLGETKTSGRDVWKIETIPNEERGKKTRYGRTVLYVDKERFVSLRTELYDKYGQEIKRMMSSKVELVNDVWVSRSITMMNLVTNRLSNIATLEINTDLVIPDEFLTQRTLTDVAFREAELMKLRRQVSE